MDKFLIELSNSCDSSAYRANCFLNTGFFNISASYDEPIDCNKLDELPDNTTYIKPTPLNILMILLQFIVCMIHSYVFIVTLISILSPLRNFCRSPPTHALKVQQLYSHAQLHAGTSQYKGLQLQASRVEVATVQPCRGLFVYTRTVASH